MGLNVYMSIITECKFHDSSSSSSLMKVWRNLSANASNKDKYFIAIIINDDDAIRLQKKIVIVWLRVLKNAFIFLRRRII